MNFTKNVSWSVVALFTTGVLMVVGGVLYENRVEVAVPLVVIGAGLAVVGILLPRLQGPVRLGPSGVEVSIATGRLEPAVGPSEEEETSVRSGQEASHTEPTPKEEASVSTPDLSVRQGYLDGAPGGIDARYAWTVPGGSGEGVSIILIGVDWCLSHEALLKHQGGRIGAQADNVQARNYGTALLGIIGGSRDSFGVAGICPEANVRAISTLTLATDKAIGLATEMLNPGDIIFVGSHRPGPKFDFQVRNDQFGYIAAEWWPEELAAIKDATGRGLIVVEPSGNGSGDLDEPVYKYGLPGFPSGWANPFDRTECDSGSIIVGAGTPPPGIHGYDHGPDRSRLAFSNYGSVVDVQGWGREVTTTGYGDLQGGTDETKWYTDSFSGTGAAAAMVVGAIACIQGVLRSQGKSPLSPKEARELLRNLGSDQQDIAERPHTQRIGPRPDLRRLIAANM